jgi:hypothetical protein
VLIAAAEVPVNDNIIFNVSPTIGDHVACADLTLLSTRGLVVGGSSSPERGRELLAHQGIADVARVVAVPGQEGRVGDAAEAKLADIEQAASEGDAGQDPVRFPVAL